MKKPICKWLVNVSGIIENNLRGKHRRSEIRLVVVDKTFLKNCQKEIDVSTSIFSAWYKIRKGTGPTQTFASGRCLCSFVPAIIWLKNSSTETHYHNAQMSLYPCDLIAICFRKKLLQSLTPCISFKLQRIANDWESTLHSWNRSHFIPFFQVTFKWMKCCGCQKKYKNSCKYNPHNI